MTNTTCKELLRAILHNASDDSSSQVGILLRSLNATWKTTDEGASIILSGEGADPQSHGNGQCNATRERQVIPLVCRRCSWIGPESKARAFVTEPSSIVFCKGRCEENLETIIVHELTHVFDMRELQLNLRECRDLAYSEVRAANFAECNSISNHAEKTRCIQKHAIAATSAALKQHRQEHRSKSCVDEVYSQAVQDERPFKTNSE